LAAKILAGQQPAAATPAAPTPVGLSINQQSPSAAVTGRDARFEENARADRAMRDREQRAANDPDLKALRVQLANMRSGDPRKTAELTKELADLRQQRYGF
jgi:thioredoxin-like negative regulator of GroEL